MTVVVVVNQKGGVGKTTLTLNLASVAARRGRSTLLVDLDPQANATTGAGVWSPERTVDAVLADPASAPAWSVAVAASWPETVGRPDVVPASPTLANREPLLAADPIGAQDRLRAGLAGDMHDTVLIDCPPSLGLLTVNGLFAADAAVIVTEPAAWAADGVDMITATLAKVGERRGRPLEIAGIVVNRLGRTRDARYWHGQLVERHGERVTDPVHLRTAVAEAAAQSLPVRALQRSGAAEAADEIEAVFDRVISDSPTPASPSSWRSVGAISSASSDALRP